MSKSKSRKRRQEIFQHHPQSVQNEAFIEFAMGNPQKLHAIAETKRNAKATYPKPGEEVPDVASVNRVSVLKVLQNQHGVTYTRS